MLSLSTCDDPTFVPNIINLYGNVNGQIHDLVDGPYRRLVSSNECCDICDVKLALLIIKVPDWYIM